MNTENQIVRKISMIAKIMRRDVNVAELVKEGLVKAYPNNRYTIVAYDAEIRKFFGGN